MLPGEQYKTPYKHQNQNVQNPNNSMEISDILINPKSFVLYSDKLEM